jgi:hypothetical protein
VITRGGRVGNYLERETIKNVLLKINANGFNARELRSHPIKLEITVSAGKTKIFTISKPSDVMALNGQSIYLGQTSQGIGRGPDTRQYIHIIDAGFDRYAVKFKGLPPPRSR